MEKIGIISDIHGNLPALQAVLEDIEKHQVHHIICLGDIVGKGPSSAEAIEICQKRCKVIVAGNWDVYLANNEGEGSVNWYREQIGEEKLGYLKELPESVGFYMSGKYVRLFHAHPHNVFTRVFANSDIEERRRMFEIPRLKRIDMEDCISDIVGYGDIHGAYMQVLDGRTLFNVGSVGNSCDKILMASYGILEGEYGGKENRAFSVQLYRVPYNIEQAIQDAEKTDLPDREAYIKEIRTAIYSRKR